MSGAYFNRCAARLFRILTDLYHSVNSKNQALHKQRVVLNPLYLISVNFRSTFSHSLGFTWCFVFMIDTLIEEIVQ